MIRNLFERPAFGFLPIRFFEPAVCQPPRLLERPFYGFDHVELARNHVDEAHAGQHYALWMEEKGCRDWRRFFQPPTGPTPAQRHRWNIPEKSTAIPGKNPRHGFSSHLQGRDDLARDIAVYCGMISLMDKGIGRTLADLPTTFLALAGVEKPRTMIGLDQSPVWLGQSESVRDHVLVENRHQPTSIHVKTYINSRYKLTVYFAREYGELFDLESDPGEPSTSGTIPPQRI